MQQTISGAEREPHLRHCSEHLLELLIRSIGEINTIYLCTKRRMQFPDLQVFEL